MDKNISSLLNYACNSCCTPHMLAYKHLVFSYSGLYSITKPQLHDWDGFCDMWMMLLDYFSYFMWFCTKICEFLPVYCFGVETDWCNYDLFCILLIILVISLILKIIIIIWMIWPLLVFIDRYLWIIDPYVVWLVIHGMWCILQLLCLNVRFL